MKNEKSVERILCRRLFYGFVGIVVSSLLCIYYAAARNFVEQSQGSIIVDYISRARAGPEFEIKNLKIKYRFKKKVKYENL